jgi:methyl-accepting chemotaxis protein
MMKNFKISTRLYFLVGLALAVFTATAVYKLYDSHNSMIMERKAKLNALDESVIAMLQHFHDLETSGTLTREEAQLRAIEAVRPMRYEDDGYFWINDMSNIMVMHPIKPALEGTDLAGLKDPTGKFFFQEFIKVVKADGEGYVDYYWPKPGAEEPVLKYSHVKVLHLGAGLSVPVSMAMTWPRCSARMQPRRRSRSVSARWQFCL